MDIPVKSRIAYLISMGIIIVAIVFVIIAGLMAFMPVTALKPNVQPYKVITKSIKAGDIVVYEVDACKYVSAPTIISRRFVDTNNTRYVLAPQESNLAPGCQKSRIPVVTPDNLPAGTWHISLDISYKVNPLRTESYHLNTEDFVVTN